MSRVRKLLPALLALALPSACMATPSAQLGQQPDASASASAAPPPAASAAPTASGASAVPSAATSPKASPDASATPSASAEPSASAAASPTPYPATDDGPIPGRHRSVESETNQLPCPVKIDVVGFPVATQDLGLVLPSWLPVEDERPRVLEGVVEPNDEDEYPAPHVSYEDFPIFHYTHDVNFNVRPDETPDHRFTNLRGTQVPDTGPETTQDLIEVEWESGLGADNDGNVCTDANVKGDSAGMYSAGHHRGDEIWAWPTWGDHVHVEGRWIWDRGHPPAECEIHPPRLTAVQRALPAAIRRDGTLVDQPDAQTLLATRMDIFANADGGALLNHRPDAPAWVQRVAMSSKDYQFEVHNTLPRPSANAHLHWAFVTHPGDTFAPQPIVELAPGTTEADGRVRVTLPWKSAGGADTDIFARTLFVYWDEGRGVSADYVPRIERVTLDELEVLKTMDVGTGEYRAFTEVGGRWLFVNELAKTDDILHDGLGDAGTHSHWPIAHSYTLVVPPGGYYRVHTSGWEADGVDNCFGHLFDPNHPCDADVGKFFRSELFNLKVFTDGSRDDPIGQVNARHDTTDAYGEGAHVYGSKGPKVTDVWAGEDSDPNDAFVLRYHVDRLTW